MKEIQDDSWDFVPNKLYLGITSTEMRRRFKATKDSVLELFHLRLSLSIPVAILSWQLDRWVWSWVQAGDTDLGDISMLVLSIALGLWDHPGREEEAARKWALWGIPVFQGPGEGEIARVSKRSRRESRREGGTEPQESGLRKKKG